MNVTVIADPIISVPPSTYGGAERIAAGLCEGLARKGHRITLVAGPGSDVYGRSFTHRAPNNRSFASRAYRKLAFQPLSLLASMDADVVYNFGRVDYLFSLLRTRIPLIQRFGNEIAPYELDILLKRSRTHLMLVSISDFQRRGHDQRGRWRTVYNGVDLETFPYSSEPDDPPYLAFLGRLTEHKGVHLAIEVARRTGIPLKIAGNVSKEAGGEAYFERRVRPELGGDIQWVGEVDDAQKAALLGGATALLFPIQGFEAFGIVLAESLACGTPVVAARRGPTPEIIRHGETGYLCDSVEDMVRAVQRVESIRRDACRRSAAQNFSLTAMVDRFESLYQEVKL